MTGLGKTKIYELQAEGDFPMRIKPIEWRSGRGPRLEKAIYEHFARKLELASRELRVLLRRGWISLLIGLAFLGLPVNVVPAHGSAH